MIIDFVLALTLLLPVFALVRRLYRTEIKNFNDMIPFLHRDNPESLEELLDHILEGYLLLNLGHKQFRKEQFKRIRLALEFITQRAHNAIFLQQWGDAEYEKSRKTLDEEVRTAARLLIQACTEYRIGALWIRCQLHLWYIQMRLMPFLPVPQIARLRRIDSFDLLHSYVNIKNDAENLASLCGDGYRERLAAIL